MTQIQAAFDHGETVEAFVQKPLREILDDTVLVFRRFVALPTYGTEIVPHGFIVLALWVAHTHTYMHVETTPYLSIWSAIMQSGKTTVLELLNDLGSRGWHFSDVTLAALTRKIDRDAPTLLYDEGDAANKELKAELGGIFNAGYKASGKRTVATGPPSNITTIDLNVYCPKAFAGIGSTTLRETPRDRSIPIELRRKKPGETVARNRARTRMRACAPLKAQFEGWAVSPGLHDPLSREVPDIPDQLDDRQQDCWEPLLAIADLAGGEWPQQARAAAIGINANRDLLASYPEMLLSDIRTVFMANDADKMFTKTLLGHLHALEERPWGTIVRGNPMTANSLASRLKDFNVRPKDIRSGEAVYKGYAYEDFAEAFARNLPAWVAPATSATAATPEAEEPAQFVADVAANTTPPAGVLMSLDLEEVAHVE